MILEEDPVDPCDEAESLPVRDEIVDGEVSTWNVEFEHEGRAVMLVPPDLPGERTEDIPRCRVPPEFLEG